MDREQEILKEHIYTDVFGHAYHAQTESARLGGQGMFLHTDEPDLALKVVCDPRTHQPVWDQGNNEKYWNLRLLPIPRGLHITRPLAPLQGVEGYVMQLLDDMEDFQSVFSLEKARFDTEHPDGSQEGDPDLWKKAETSKRAKLLYSYMADGGIRRRLMAYGKVAAILARLHASGLVYGDFSMRNAFVSKDPAYQEVWLIDADNIDFAENLTDTGYFTPGVAAPELVCGQRGNNVYADSFAYASALFQQLFFHHPFEGEAFEAQLEQSDYADDVEAVRDQGGFAWILDTEDASNMGEKYLLLPKDFVLTDHLFSLFQQTFCYDGCTCPESRATMLQWAYETAWAHDNTVWSAKYGADYVRDGADYEICPYDDCRVCTLRLYSFLLDEAGEKAARLWQFTHELPENGCIQVPQRILYGFSCRSWEEGNVLRVERSARGILLQPLTFDGVVSYSETADSGREDFQKAGSYLTRKNAFSILFAATDGRHILIEGEIRGE